jgi:hypothetical protein
MPYHARVGHVISHCCDVCHVVPFHAMPFHAGPCHVIMLCRGLSHTVPFHAMPCWAMPCDNAVSCCVMMYIFVFPFYVMLGDAIMHCRDALYVMLSHSIMPCWTMPSCCLVMCVMLFHSIPCLVGPCHHAVS